MFHFVERNGTRLLFSDKIKSRHGFSTRIGGFSTNEHTNSLNLAFNLGDEDEIVLKNLDAFADALGVDSHKIVSVPQVHGNEVRSITEAQSGFGMYKKAPFSCDGYVTDVENIPLGVKTADCVPILLEALDDEGNVLAVCALHAGWRGTAAKIAKVGVEKLISLGAKAENIRVAIGPSIDVCCYEIGEDFASEINKQLGQNYENEFIKENENGKKFASLKGMNLKILLECGVPEENIDISENCTCCDSENFYSHRRQKGIRGSMMSIICK